MAKNPLNLVLSFLLEVSALAAMGYWGWKAGEGPFRWVLTIGTPLLAATLWGVFRVPEDPGKAPVPIPASARFLLELVFFAFAIWCLFAAGQASLGWGMLAITSLHYIVSYDRIIRFLKNVVT